MQAVPGHNKLCIRFWVESHGDYLQQEEMKYAVRASAGSEFALAVTLSGMSSFQNAFFLLLDKGSHWGWGSDTFMTISYKLLQKQNVKM